MSGSRLDSHIPRMSQTMRCLLMFLFIFTYCAQATVYSNIIGVRIAGGKDVADKVAKDTGLINLGQIGDLDDCFKFMIPDSKERSDLPSLKHRVRLEEHEQVLFFEQQVYFTVSLRDFQTRDVPNQMNIRDKCWKHQWYLNGGTSEEGHDMNVDDIL